MTVALLVIGGVVAFDAAVSIIMVVAARCEQRRDARTARERNQALQTANAALVARRREAADRRWAAQKVEWLGAEFDALPVLPFDPEGLS